MKKVVSEYFRCQDALDKGDPASVSASETVECLRNERYISEARQADAGNTNRLLHATYYWCRPFLPLLVRKHIQRIYLRDWRRISFPRWPVDCSVDVLLQTSLAQAAKDHGLERVPFIWFWPDGASACSIVTHDVEAEAGYRFCPALMSLDERFGIPASFQIVPEERYEVARGFLDETKARGFEINVQDLNHDGRLFRDYDEFVRRVAKINRYGQEFGAKGFRAAMLYRNQDWFNLLRFDYDMSVPNVAHLDPQRGGCCTVMPYFIGDMLELPVTTTQDHTLFNVLNDHSIALWRQQSERVMEQHGLLSFIVHPDYIVSSQPRKVYTQLLEFLTDLRAVKNVWIARPGEVDQWWRQRSQMRLTSRHGELVVEGPGHERARIAYACVERDRVVYEFSDKSPSRTHSTAGRALSMC